MLNLFLLIPLKSCQVFSKITVLMIANRINIIPANEAPMIPPMVCSLGIRVLDISTKNIVTTAIQITTKECPNEKQKPIPCVFFPSFIIFLVILSITEIWSISKACCNPKTKDNRSIDSNVGNLERYANVKPLPITKSIKTKP